jgi:lipopolysaccharide/colanic/teichoic acid biosynthesis glycosyltransferase
MIIIAIAVKCSDGGPVFYKQERLGYKGKKFYLVKFRSMKVDAEKDGARWSDGDDDPRITKVGRFLRKTRLDEIPQFFSCFTGKMSLVGPRPEREIFYDEFEKHIHSFRERLKVKPGFTGYAQVNGGYDLRPEEKIVFDVEYIKKRGFWLDVGLLFKTVFVVFSHKGAK